MNEPKRTQASVGMSINDCIVRVNSFYATMYGDCVETYSEIEDAKIGYIRMLYVMRHSNKTHRSLNRKLVMTYVPFRTKHGTIGSWQIFLLHLGV